jgi:triphosphoribosyl-dephospho-CoA synthetase
MKDPVQMWAETSAVTANMLQKMVDINTGLSTALLCQNVEMLNIFAESSLKQLQLFSKARTSHDFLQGQSRNLKDFSRKTTNNALITTEIMSSTRMQIENLMNNILKQMLETHPVPANRGTVVAEIK